MNRETIIGEWHRAVRSLGAAEILMRSDYREDSVSRSYYALLHAAKSALLVHDVETSSHSAARSMFGLHLVRTGEIERKWARDLAEGMDDRLMADYSVHTHFSDGETQQEYERSKGFLERIRQYLIANGLTEQELDTGNSDG